VSVVEAKLGLFLVQIEGMGKYPLELGQTELGKSPEQLNAVDVACAPPVNSYSPRWPRKCLT